MFAYILYIFTLDDTSILPDHQKVNKFLDLLCDDSDYNNNNNGYLITKKVNTKIRVSRVLILINIKNYDIV
jgi:hypothetical protein